MSKTIPTTYNSINQTSFFAGQEVKESEWTDAIENSNYIYIRSGCKTSLLGRIDAWETASGTQTVTDSSAVGLDLDLYQTVIRPRRVTDNSGTSEYLVQAWAFLKNIDVQVLMRDPSGTHADKNFTLSASGGGVGETVKSGATFTASEVLVSWHVSIVGALSTSGTGSLWGITMIEEQIAAAKLP